MTVEKVVKKVSLRQQPKDLSYWLAQPPEARISALEEIRREYHLWKYNAEPRLQRVYSITKRS